MKKLAILVPAFFLSMHWIAFAGPPSLPDTSVPAKENYLRIADEVEKSLQDDDLKKLFPAAVDERGGFFENFKEDWTHRGDPDADSTRSVVYQSRLVWLAAKAAMLYPAGAVVYRGYVRHGVQFLADRQWDKSSGGFWWSVDVTGRNNRSGDKHIYGNAFAVYALAAAYQATHDEADLDLAKKGFLWMEANAHDDRNGGYFEQIHADGSHATAASAGGRGRTDVLGARPGQKTMNAHIHILEALTGLLEVWPDQLVKKRTEEMYQIGLKKIYADPGYLRLYFSEDWTPVEGYESYGHDIETAYLFSEAAAALGKPDDPACWDTAQKIVDHCLKVGFDPQSGSLNNEGTITGTGFADRSRVWWVQAESLNALLLMHERFGQTDPKYWNAFIKQWSFITSHQIDQKNGGWFNTLNADNTPLGSKLAKTDAWTEGYHQGRAMMNVTDRLRRLARGG